MRLAPLAILAGTLTAATTYYNYITQPFRPVQDILITFSATKDQPKQRYLLENTTADGYLNCIIREEKLLHPKICPTDDKQYDQLRHLLHEQTQLSRQLAHEFERLYDLHKP